MLRLCNYVCLLAALVLVALLVIVTWLLAGGSSTLAAGSVGAVALVNAALEGGLYILRNSFSREEQTAYQELQDILNEEAAFARKQEEARAYAELLSRSSVVVPDAEERMNEPRRMTDEETDA